LRLDVGVRGHELVAHVDECRGAVDGALVDGERRLWVAAGEDDAVRGEEGLRVLTDLVLDRQKRIYVARGGERVHECELLAFEAVQIRDAAVRTDEDLRLISRAQHDRTVELGLIAERTKDRGTASTIN